MAQLMKGETFKDALKLVRGKPRFEYPLYVEVKADEIRCQIIHRVPGVVEYLSYAGKPLHNLDFLTPAIEALCKHTGYYEFDVGILVNGNFNDSYRWTRSSSGEPKEKLDKKTGKVAPALDKSMVEIILFDLPTDDTVFSVRIGNRRWVAGCATLYGLPVRTPSGQWAYKEEDVWDIYRKYREELGEEGAMAKTADHLYERKRSYNWMKVKPSDDIDGKIAKLNEAHSESGEPLGRVGSVDVVMVDGSTASPAGFPHELGRLMWENPEQYVGQWLTFNYMERDRKGGYRHPHFERFREDK